MSKNLFIFILSAFTMVASVGCMEKRGCTDVNSDNFDSEATQDDDTCVPTREKFLGDFEANGTIEIGQDTLIPYEQVGLNIVDSTAVGPTGMIVGISNFDVPVNALSAQVTSTYKLNIVRQTLGTYTYFGEGNINGRVLELKMTRLEEITLPDASVVNDTIKLNLYAIKELEE